MVHTRETRASASEIKLLIDPALAPHILEWARENLKPDPHGNGPFDDEYDTASLYFDTRHFDVFHRRRSYARAKYRVRRYGHSDMIFLERKLRQPGILVKRRTVESIHALTRLAEGNTDSDWDGAWFHRRLLIRRLRPACQVSYHRTARVIACPDGMARLTLDSRLRGVATEIARFSDDAGISLLDDHMILELKYRARLPAIFRRLIEQFPLSTAAASKYRLAMAALGHVPASDEPAVLSSAGMTYG
jgi:VTC domain